MLRMIIAMALVFAALYFYLQDKKETQVTGEQQKELIDNAKLAKEVTEQAAAAAAVRSDAIRDQALGKPGAEDSGN